MYIQTGPTVHHSLDSLISIQTGPTVHSSLHFYPNWPHPIQTGPTFSFPYLSYPNWPHSIKLAPLFHFSIYHTQTGPTLCIFAPPCMSLFIMPKLAPNLLLACILLFLLSKTLLETTPPPPGVPIGSRGSRGTLRIQIQRS